MEKYAGENHKNIKRISTPAIDMLMEYHWPGNVRELENCIERAVLLCEEGVIHCYHLPPTLQTGKESDTLPPCPWKMLSPAYRKKGLMFQISSATASTVNQRWLTDNTETMFQKCVKQHKSSSTNVIKTTFVELKIDFLFFSTINALKYFEENANEYHVIAAGSLQGIKLAGQKSFLVYFITYESAKFKKR